MINDIYHKKVYFIFITIKTNNKHLSQLQKQKPLFDNKQQLFYESK